MDAGEKLRKMKLGLSNRKCSTVHLGKLIEEKTYKQAKKKG